MTKPAYKLDDFLDDVQNHPENISVEQQAEDRAKELGLNSTAEIKDYLKKLNKEDFKYKNTAPYRNHVKKPLVDAYNINDEYKKPYLAYYNTSKWWIKSLHTSNEHHDSPFGNLKEKLQNRVKI